MAKRSVERTKKLPWNDAMRKPKKSVIQTMLVIILGVKRLVHTPRSANAHDGLQHDRHGQHLPKLMGKLEGILRPRSVESGVVVSLTRGVMR